MSDEASICRHLYEAIFVDRGKQQQQGQILGGFSTYLEQEKEKR